MKCISDKIYEMNLNKLVTKEDPLYIHKFLGLVSLSNYFYRFLLLFSYGSMFFNTPFDIGLVFLHGCLSMTSMIYHIPKNRHAKLPMIYPEFRLHSIAFGLRSVFCCFVDFYCGAYNLYYKMCISIATMLAADWITAHYSQPGNTTIRSMPYDEHTPEKDRLEITKFYSNQQVNATLFMLLNIDASFSPLFAIQIAAFLMTLVRKNIIRPNSWHLVYSWALMVNIFIFNTLYLSLVINVIIGTHIFRLLRMNMRMNKYICWSIVFSLFNIFTSPLSMLDKWEYKQPLIHCIIVTYLAKNIYTTSTLYMIK
jgi:hypothetical protein